MKTFSYPPKEILQDTWSTTLQREYLTEQEIMEDIQKLDLLTFDIQLSEEGISVIVVELMNGHELKFKVTPKRRDIWSIPTATRNGLMWNTGKRSNVYNEYMYTTSNPIEKYYVTLLEESWTETNPEEYFDGNTLHMLDRI